MHLEPLVNYILPDTSGEKLMTLIKIRPVYACLVYIFMTLLQAFGGWLLECSGLCISSGYAVKIH